MTTIDTDVRAAASGDREAYGRLIDQTHTLVTSLCFAELRDRVASEDLAQDVYLAAWQALPKLREPASFVPWLRQLARNRARHARDERSKRPAPTEDEVLAAATDPRPGPAEAAVSSEERRVLEEALSELDSDDREVLVLYYREGQSIAQVAALLELSEGAAKKRLSRARGRLRAELLERFSDLVPRGDGVRAAVLAALPVSAAAAAAAGVGLGAGALGIGFAYRETLKGSVDETDRRETRRIFQLMLGLCGAFAVSVAVAATAAASMRVVYGLVAGLVGGMFYLAGFRNLALLRRRAERTGDQARYRRERARVVLGFVLGGAACAATLWCL